MFTESDDYWLHSSPSSFNEDLKRENGWRRRKEDLHDRKRGGDGVDGGKEKKVTKKAYST